MSSTPRSRRLSHPTQRAELIFASVAALIDRAADGRYFRLIGVGIGDLGPAAGADPTDLFSLADMPKLQGPKLQGPKLQGPKLQGAKLQSPKLQGENLQGAYLQAANVEAAEVQGAEVQSLPSPAAATQR